MNSQSRADSSTPSNVTGFAPSEPQPREDYEHLLFARGWYITEGDPSFLPDWWRSLDLGGRQLVWDSRLECVVSESGSSMVVMLGHAIDLRKNTSNLASIAATLHATRLESRAAYFNALAWLTGRYVVIDRCDGDMFLQSDAVGMRSVFYSAARRIVGSHQNLVKEIAGINRLSYFGSTSWRASNKAAVCYPGNETSWQGVKFLNANHEINLDTFEIRRVPLDEPEALSIEEVADTVLRLIRRQIPHLVKTQKPIVSLTAGQDSRTTLASLGGAKNEFQYFTYALKYSTRRRAVQLDVDDSRRLAGLAGLEHWTLLNLEGPLEDESLEAVLERNSIKKSNRNVAGAYLHTFPETAMHVRSSFNEIGVAAYRTKYGHHGARAEVFADILTFEKGYSKETLDACSAYIESTGMLEVPGYDPFDLWYWEIRMGSWLGTILHESDIAFDTHILMGSREIVRILQSAPLKERGAIKTYDALITKAWPELYEVPVNGVKRP